MRIIRLITVALCLLAADVIHAQPRVPEYMVFAGDTIRFDTADRRERMDREILTFCYMHSTSKLVIKRANRYFPQVEPLLRLSGVPDDLKYLMVIESSLDPKALSSAGAAGFWQFMKTTAKDYGLIIDAEVDERYNTRKATLAACKYLRDSYAKFGDWMSVAASYNGGQAGIARRLSDQHQDSALDLWLVEETSRYMYRLLACKMYFEDPEAFGFTFTAESLYPYIPIKEEVMISEPVASLVDFAEQHGVSYADLKRANLWLRDSVLLNKDRRTYLIAIPDIEAERAAPSATQVHDTRWLRKPLLYK